MIANLQPGLWPALTLGAFVRLIYPLGADFPLNDGGMLYTMTNDLMRNGFRLPVFTSYNGIGLPFAYPPAAFYLAGALARWWSLLDVLRVVPPLLSVLALPAFYLLARDLLCEALGAERGRRAAHLALLAFALIPSSFQWQIMGGGLTRSLGYLAALIALRLEWRLVDPARGGREAVPYLVAGACALALAIGSHPELGWFAVFSTVVLCWGRGVRAARRSFGRLVSLALLALLLTAPWWAQVLAHHGLAPYLAAFATGEHGHAWALPFQVTSFTGEPWLTVWACLGLFGLLVCLRDRRFLFPAWILAVYLLDPRKGMSLGAMPLALMIGYGLERALAGELRRPLGRVALAGLAAYGTVAALALAVTPLPSWAVLPQSEREAMTWVRENTLPDADFLVVTSTWLWARDQSGEWFPALADRASLTTVQGREWLPGPSYAEARDRFARLSACADAACLAGVAPHAYVYISKTAVLVDAGVRRDLALPLRRSLRTSPAYALVFENDGAEVYAAVADQSIQR